MKQEFYERLREILGEEGQVQTDEPLKKHTTFRIGGPAKYFCLPKTPQQLSGIIAACRTFGEDYYILGNGSNLLVGDKGYRGVVLKLAGPMEEI